MTQFILTKLSDPGFEFAGSEAEVRDRLYSCICSSCKYVHELDASSPLNLLWMTECAAEFMIEDA